jgi:hypothetical protein
MTDALASENNIDLSFRITLRICFTKNVFVRTDIDALPKVNDLE